MDHFTPVASTLGGVLLGLASSLLYVANGRICGISGILGGFPSAPGGDRAWRLVFLAGLLTGGLLLAIFDDTALALASEQTVPVAIGAGVLVGIGTRLGSGCTSGHGLCGIARLSKRSIAATGIFMAAAAVTVFVVRHVLHLSLLDLGPGGGGAS
ncbi:MAG: YeeE/YedE family protein, partial [Polyangiaceae bacterium]